MDCDLRLNDVYQENCNKVFNQQEIYNTLAVRKRQLHALKKKVLIFEILMVVTMKMTVVFNVMSCRLVELQSFGVTYCFHLRSNNFNSVVFVVEILDDD